MNQDKKFIKNLLNFYQSQLLAGYYSKRGKALVVPNAIFCIQRLLNSGQKNVHVLDLGCGRGNLLKVLHALAKSMGLGNKVKFYGLDFDEDLINQAKQEDGEGITYFHRDLRHDLLEDLDGKFDLILCVNTIHEVFSSYLQDADNPPTMAKIDSAKNKIFSLAKQISRLLTESGSLVFYDGLNLSAKEAMQTINFKIKTKILAHEIDKFISEYALGRISYKKRANIYSMTASDFLKFAATFKYLNSKLWPIESQETYFYFSQAEIKKMVENMGLILEYRAIINNDLGLWQHHLELLNKKPFPSKTILFVASKKYLYSEFDYFC